MNYAVEMSSGAIKIGLGIQKLIWGIQTLLLFVQNNDSRLKTDQHKQKLESIQTRKQATLLHTVVCFPGNLYGKGSPYRLQLNDYRALY
jgi:hypothetical protein